MERLSKDVGRGFALSASSTLLVGFLAVGAAWAQTNTPPTVSLTAPGSSANFTSPATVALTATAADTNGSITRVQFYRGTTLIGTDTTSPYSFNWTGVAPGTYSLTARATDNQGAVTTSATRSITVTNTPPTVSLTAPASGANFTSPATVALTATAADTNGSITRVQFYRGTTLIGTDTTSPYSFNWTGVAPGTYSITAQATDNQGAVTTSAARSITVTNTPPTVSLTAPADGAGFTSPATVALTATAADTNGSITRVQFYQGTTLIGTDTTSPYSFNWTSVAPGTYSITARATDNLGAVTTSAARSITVTNIAPTVSVTAPAAGASFTAPATVSIAATAADGNGTVASVAFYNGATLLGTDTTSPYSFNWVNVAAGIYGITARATDNLGAVTTSSAVSVTVAAPNTPPTVSISAPAAGASFTAPATVTIAANAADANGTVSQVQFYNGTTLLGIDTTAPYSFSWTNVAAGTYSITARATDNSGAVTTSAAVSVTVAAANTAPTVGITAPAAGASFTAPATVAITANAADANGTVSQVQFYNGTTLLGSDTTAPYSFSWTNVAAGTYSVTARATDNNGAVTDSAAVSVIVAAANTAPTVNLTSPAAGASFTAPATVAIAANASDTNGTVTQVQFYNGTTLLGTDTTAPYSFNLTDVPAGSYSITAQATDNQGAVTTSAPVTVSVQASQSLPTVQITSPLQGAQYRGAPASVTVTAQATGGGGTVSRVEFYSGSQLILSDSSAPYTFTLTAQSLGNYSIYARVYNSLGQSDDSAPVSFSVVNNLLPTVALIAPDPAGAYYAPANLNLQAQASDSDGSIASVSFYNGSTLLGTVQSAPYVFNWTGVPTGSYQLSARATDDAGAVSTSVPVQITVSPAPGSTDPVVSLSTPQAGATFVAPAIIDLSAQASASAGRTITSVAFFNGTQWLGSATEAPYSYRWQDAPAGNHEIIARVTDSAGVTTSSASVLVTVSSSSSQPSVRITSPQASAQFRGAPASVTVTAQATGGAGTVSKVEFYGSSGLILSDSRAPYTFTLTAQSLGNYGIYARVINSLGEEVDSEAVGFSVVDNLRPTVQLFNPSAGSYHHAPASLSLQAQASDSDGSIASVSFYNGSTLLGTVQNAPYVFNWTGVPAGSYQLSARATDNNGAVGQSAEVPVFVVVSADAPRPSVSLSAPLAGANFRAPAIVALSATASASAGRSLVRVDFYNGSTLLGSATNAPYSLNWTNVASGTYQVRAHAIDDIGAEGISPPVSVVVAPDDRPPTVSLTSPTVAQVHLAPARVTLSAAAGANQDRTLTSLTFFNGQTPIATLTQAPYVFEWENVAAGNHAISARATDSAGVQVATPVRYVEVLGSDQAPSVSIVSPRSGERFASPGRVPILLNASVGSARTVRSLAVYSSGNRVVTYYYAGVGEVGGIWADVPAGTHALTAELVDDVGHVATSAPVEIVVSNAESAIRLDVHVDRYQASAYIQDPSGLVNRVEFHRTHNGQQTVHLGTRYNDPSWRAFIYADVYATPGEHRFVAVAFDAAGNELIRSAQRSYTVPTISSIELTEPAMGLELAGPVNVSISGRVSLSSGVPASVLSHVDVYLGNALAFSNVSLAPDGRFVSQLTQLPLGVHDIRVRVVLSDGTYSEVHRRVRVLDASDPYLLRILMPAEGEHVLVNNGYPVMVLGYTEQRSDWDRVVLEGRPNNFITNFGGEALITDLVTAVRVELPGANQSAHYRAQSARVVGTTRQGAKRVSAWVNYTEYQRRIQFRYGQTSFQIRVPGFNDSIGVIQANDCTGCIAAVEVLRGEEVLQRQTQAPFYFNMYSLPIGVHTLTLRMIPVDESQGVASSGPVTVTVTGDNTLPTVNLTSPISGTTFPTLVPFYLTAQATDPGGSVSRVEFYQGDQLVGSSTVPSGNSSSTTYRLYWTPPANGRYVLTARAVDSNGAVSVSRPAFITVGQDPGDPNARETITYIFTDISGSPLVGTNATGNVLWKENYAAFGSREALFPGTEGQRQWFHGKEVDAETGLQNFGARHYDAVLGRFLSIDPVGFQEDNLHSFNRYAYGNNNPVRYLDPDGNSPIDANHDGHVSLQEEVGIQFRLVPQTGDVVQQIVPSMAGGWGRSSAPMGNAKASTNAQHGYQIRDTKTELIVKTGVSGGKRTQSIDPNTGLAGSYRANKQAARWGREAKDSERYQVEVVKEVSAGAGARQQILKWEKENASSLRSEGHLTDLDKHVRP